MGDQKMRISGHQESIHKLRDGVDQNKEANVKNSEQINKLTARMTDNKQEFLNKVDFYNTEQT